MLFPNQYLPFSIKYFKFAEQIVSWLRLPFVWSGWLIFAPNYLTTLFIDVSIAGFLYVLNQNNAFDPNLLIPYAYELLNTSCILETYSCREVFMQVDPIATFMAGGAQQCKHVCENYGV